MNNTKKKGIYRFIIYKRTRDKNYTGVCLDLDIVEEEKDPVILKKSLEEAAQGYLEAVNQSNLPEDLLNKDSSAREKLPILDSQIFYKLSFLLEIG